MSLAPLALGCVPSYVGRAELRRGQPALALLGLDSTAAVVHAPRLLQAASAALADLAVHRLARRCSLRPPPSLLTPRTPLAVKAQ
jgi:hypothetical protein